MGSVFSRVPAAVLQARCVISDGRQGGNTDVSAVLFDVSVDAGGTAKVTAPTKPGSYPHHCTFHSNMHGTLVVK
jgi:plastocyanin